ncbi:unnamed protein product [Linum tenue]|uniref:F-box domain-containing protein n=1 Tax=Linum tenue TaxID=586396 RepID=A0AAV0IKL6_9ROSI|nr:unnamed protein product [Linum tenue]
MDDDRLSSLPDEILSYIISFLPTKFAVGTAVLGRRWKHLWTRVCNLDFDNTIWGCHGAKSRHRKPSCSTRRDKYFGFCRFVDRVLSEHKNLDSLKRLSLHFEEGYPYSYGNRYLWLKMELGSGSLLEEIDVNFKAEDGTGPTFPMHRLPEFFYTLKHLRVLKLDGVVMETGSSVFLPNMKNLQLLRVKIVDGESLGRLLSGCPALETAHLETDHMKIDEYLHRKEECKLIASLPCLKNLTIVRFHCITHWAIEAPSIEHLHLRSVVAELQFLGSSKFPCLDSVTVLGSVGMIWELCLLYFLQQISNAKELSFSWQPLVRLHFPSSTTTPNFFFFFLSLIKFG